MAIHFSEEQWKRVRESYDLWWEHRLERPLISVKLKGLDPGRPEPKAPLLSQQSALDLSWSAEEIIDRLDYELSQYEFLGDAYPHVNFDAFGPGVAAAFMGATPDNSTGSIWFHVPEYKEISDLHFEYDPDNVWLNRIKDLYRAGNAKWHGKVLMGMADLGGNLDILATFRGTENLLMDLYDEPEEVQRCIWEIEALWMRYYDELNSILEECNQGYSDWSRIFSSKRSYVLQSDFCYMIGNPMFKEFVLPQLTLATRRIPNTIYHLDGPGELNHLDDLCRVNTLNAIQWVPGSGNKPQTQWPEVYQKIAAAGKGIQVWEGFKCVEAVSQQIGTFKGIEQNDIVGDLSKKDEYIAMLKKFGVEP